MCEARSFHAPHPNRARFWKRFAMCASIYPACGARTGRALQNGLHAKCEQSIGSSIGEGPSGGPRQWINNGLARRLPSPKAPRQWKAFALPEGVHSPMAPRQWKAFALPLACAHAVLQCAPRARTKGRAMLRTRLSASKDAPATGKGEKGLRESLHLSPPKAKQSLVKGTREAPPCAKEPQTNSGRARTGPRPIRPGKDSRP